MKKMKKILLIAAFSLSIFAANAVIVRTSCGGVYNVGGCETMEDLLETVEALESLCP